MISGGGPHCLVLARGRAWIWKKCRASIGPDAGAKLRFSVSNRVFAIAGIKQREHLVAYIGLRKRGLILCHTNQSDVS